MKSSKPDKGDFHCAFGGNDKLVNRNDVALLIDDALSVDTTANNVVSVQFKRSGSTAEKMQVHDIDVIAMN